MEKFFFKPLVVFIFWISLFTNIVCAQNVEINHPQNDIPTSIALTSGGNIILAGYTKSFDDGSDQAYLINMTHTGDIIWEKTMGNIYGDRIFDVCIDKEDHILVTGESWLGFGGQYGRENIFVASLNTNGDILRQKSFYGYHRDMGLRIKPTDDGNYILAGYTKSTADKIGQMLIAKINPSLDTLWQRILGENRSVDYAFDVMENENGYLVSGTIGGFFNSVQDDYLTPKSRSYLAQLSPSGTLIWEKKYGGSGNDWIERSLCIDNEIYSVGSTQSIGNGSFDMLLLKTTLNGDSLFAKSFGGKSYDQGRRMIDAKGKLILVGQQQGSDRHAAIFIVCSDLQGNKLWEKTIESSISDKMIDIVYDDKHSSVYCLAQSYHSETKKDFWLFKMDLSGNIDFISDVASSHHSFYPNPVSGMAHIKYKTLENKTCELLIFNNMGQLLKIQKSKASMGVFNFSTQNMNAGSYYYQLIFDQDKKLKGKFIVY